MRSVDVCLNRMVDDSYSIRIEHGSAPQAIARMQDEGAFMLVDSNVHRLYPHLFNGERLFLLNASETEKTFSTVEKVLGWLNASGCRRDGHLAVVGGGIAGDIGGFAAAVYMRGIPFTQIPTTLLSMVDSSVGGKTGVNFGDAKNNIGAFSQPSAVVIDPQMLDTLPEEEYINGIAEVIKYGAMFDASFFQELKQKREAMLRRDAALLEDVIARCCQFKAQVVEVDEKEKGVRRHLNYGHTFGHAIETETHHAVKHGYAVATGMYLESLFAAERGLAPMSVADDVRELILSYGFSDNHAIVDEEAFFVALGKDKKATKSGIVFALPKEMGMGEVFGGIAVNDTVRFFQEQGRM